MNTVMKHKTSLKTGFLSMIILCWLVPLVLAVVLAGVLLGASYEESAQQEVDANAQNAMHHMKIHLDEAIYDSKSISYDGAIRRAYRIYQQDRDNASLYWNIKNYLTRTISRQQQYKALFVCFWDENVDADVYALNSGISGYELLQEHREITPQILSRMENAGTDICFMLINGNLYLARNLLDSHFEAYATMIIMLDASQIFHPLDGLNRISNIRMSLGGTSFYFDEQGDLVQIDDDQTEGDVQYTVEENGYEFSFTANIDKYDVWAENPWLYVAVFAVVMMLLPLLIVVILLFRKHVTHPMQVLLEAHQLVESGNRGYQISEKAPSEEFGRMYDQFNDMSQELEKQFERSILEQQASQKAQINALQSQINPHFLNNTLEIINWEARLADNLRISAMIEALSTMLSAALDRNGRTQIPLSEELSYVDAYLYIIQERLGEEFRVFKQIDPEILSCKVPRLILQPIVENAVEHDITARHGGKLWVRAYLHERDMVLEVEHDGTMTPEDRENIGKLLSGQIRKSHVGLQNVYQRLQLIYGEQGILRVEETSKGTILARICFPADSGKPEGENST